MHMTIVALVRAQDDSEALSEAKRVFEALVEQGSSFDGFQLDEAYKYDSEKGKSLLQTVLGYQILEFNVHLAKIRDAIRAGPLKSDDQLMEDDTFRYHCLCVGESKGSSIRVYDEDAEGIMAKAHLKNVVEDWPSLVKSGKHTKTQEPLWVVSADSHY
jgi:hypothetical protein